MPSTARARARAAITAEITTEARRQLAQHGAAGLSLRAVARELGMVSSAIYRYFASRDELLTALIVEAYDAMGGAAERAAADAAAAGRRPHRQWVEVALAVRRWAVDHPHEYALLYGSPVPGYQAPEATVDPGTRVTRTLVGIVHNASPAAPAIPVELPAEIAADLARLRTAIDLDVPDRVAVMTLLAWTQLFGLLGFELFNQTRGIVSHHERFFELAAATMATAIGL